jgi:putative hydrolase of the HAD superfamily
MTLKQPVKGIFLDFGWTMAYPITKNYWLPQKALEFINLARLAAIPEARRNEAFTKSMEYLDNNHFIITETEEFDQFKEYYRILAGYLPELAVTEEIIEIIAYDKVFNDKNFIFFDDTIETIKKLSEKYKLGIISDTWPSLERILKNVGIYDCFYAKTFSCFLGTYKPDPKMYEHALAQMCLPAEQTVFVDDSADNLDGAAQSCIQPVLITSRPDIKDSDKYLNIKKLSDLLLYL